MARKKYGKDVFSRVKSLIIDDKGKTLALLRGLDVRLIADAPLEDLELQSPEEVLRYRHRDIIEKHTPHFRRALQRRELERECLYRGEVTVSGEGESREEAFFEVPGKVLHIDGDEEYLDKCLHAYERLRVPVKGIHIPEEAQALKMEELLKEHTPDILVITGHEGLMNKSKAILDELDAYRHSKHFVPAVRAARTLRPSHEDLVIFAGACQSHYEALLKAGATFASSPQRILIHAYDPVFVVEKIAYSSIREDFGPPGSG